MYQNISAKLRIIRGFPWKSLVLSVLILLGIHIIFIYKTTLIVTGSQMFAIRLYILLSGLFLLSRFLVILFYEDEHLGGYKPKDYPSVSFVIAGKNEEESIYRTIKTCMDSDYPGLMECIAIDDGSTDNTHIEMQRIAKKYAKSEGVQVIRFEKNRGKREAMAEGILAAKGEIVVFVDSDSFLSKHALRHLNEHFMADKKVAAVAGNTGVENEGTNLLTKMQSARYGISFDIFKACESVFGTVTCCPGCFSAYRRDVLLKVLNPWRNQMLFGTRSTFGDDRSLTNFVLRDWKVVYCQKATAFTIVPDKYMKFIKQQLRWKKSWIREGVKAASFIWRKNIIASTSFYTNLLLPIFSPVIVFYAIFIELMIFHRIPYIFFIARFIPRSSAGNTSSRPRENMRNISAVHLPMPFTCTSSCKTSSSDWKWNLCGLISLLRNFFERSLM